MVIGCELSDIHALEVSVNVKVAVPEVSPVTKPLLVILATDGLLLVHVPPIEGKNCVVEPIQTALSPIRLIIGFEFTVTGAVGRDTQPEEWVNVKVAIP